MGENSKITPSKVGELMFEIPADSLKELLKIREKEGKWVDNEDQVGILKTLEALTCFASMSNYYDNLRRLDSSFNLVKIPEEILKDDIESILSDIEEIGYPPYPYLKEDFDKNNIVVQKGKTDFTETVAFVVTTFLDLLEYANIVYKKSKFLHKNTPLYKKLLDNIKNGVEWLKNNAIIDEDGESIYWSWGRRDVSNIPSVYFTWNAVVALSESVQSRFSPISEDEKEGIKELLRGVSKWLNKIIVKDEDFPERDRYRIKYRRFGDSFSGRHESLLIYITSIIDWLRQAEVYVNEELILKVLKTVVDFYKSGEANVKFKSGQHLLRLEKEITDLDHPINLEYEDRSFDYVMVSALSWYSWAFNEKRVLIIEEDLYKQVIDFVTPVAYERVVKMRREDNKLWSQEEFNIYLTQRALESIVSFLRYVYPYTVQRSLTTKQAVELAVKETLKEIVPEIEERLISRILNMLKISKSKGKEA